VSAGADVQRELLSTVDATAGVYRDHAADQLAREALLALSSDWAFMVTKDSAAGYARGRAETHRARFAELAWTLRDGRQDDALATAARLRAEDGPFGHLDARALAHARIPASNFVGY
jgi:1,4-alpha-glucan branching enzyme